MSDLRTYTAYVQADDIDVEDRLIARHLTAVEAMKIAFGHEDGWSTRLEEEDYGSFTLFIWWSHPKMRPDVGWTEHLQATVVRTDRPEIDRMTAMDTIAAQFLRRQTTYWKGRITSDEDYEKRTNLLALRREVRRIDREVATKLVDALLADGYTITCDLMEDDPEFERSTDRNGILDHMFQVEMVEIHVHKGESRSWLRLIFNESGWDLIQDYSVDLEYLIDPICEPYLPWNQPNADELDHGIRMLVLKSPDDVLKIEDMLK